MPASAPKRLAFLAAVVLLTAVTTYCSKTAVQSTNNYMMMAADSTGPVCVHLDMPYSDWLCPFSREADYFMTSQVAAETLVVHTIDNRTIRIAVPNRTDAIFLTQSSVSTFLLRHYDATDTTKARAVRSYMVGKYKKP